jgi:glycosyltransferase involved in cell wall biosynthesis
MKTLEQSAVSIIIVVLNGEKTLRRAIESVVNQTHARTELIIVDGGSTDDTLKIIGDYHNRIAYFISRKDGGIYDAMNHALGECRADWCLFLGCDDVLIDCLHLVAARLKDSQAVYYGNVILRSSGAIYSGRFSRLKLIYRNICHQAIFYPKSCFAKKYDTRYELLADYKYNIELWGSGVTFRYLNHIVADYNNCGSAAAGDSRFSSDKAQILRVNLGLWTAIVWNCLDFLVSIYRKRNATKSPIR